MIGIRWAGLGLLLALAGTAAAESVERRATFPARYREASDLRSLAVARIDGRDGGQLGAAIERALGDARYFDLMAGRWSEADARLSGVVTTGVDQRQTTQSRRTCTEKTNGKCTTYARQDVQCTTRVITLNADLRLVDRDGRVLYSVAKPRRDEASWCPDDSQPSAVEEVVRRMIEDVARDVRLDLAPDDRVYRVRFQEGRKGMPRDLADRFKRAVVASTSDLAGACATWTDLDRTMPDNAAVTFNLALCAEARADYDTAERLYGAAAQLGGDPADEARNGLDRVRGLRQEAEDLRRRAA